MLNSWFPYILLPSKLSSFLAICFYKFPYIHPPSRFGPSLLSLKEAVDLSLPCCVRLCQSLSQDPTAPECEYRGIKKLVRSKSSIPFFQNGNVKESDILATHNKTIERTKAHKRVLVIQDTSYDLNTFILVFLENSFLSINMF